MQKFKKALIFFLIGGFGYGLIEIIWRGYTHISMFFAGGICFNLFSHIAKLRNRKSLFTLCILGSLSVTAVEFVFGCVFNLWLNKNVWDYSKIPFNIAGQICPVFSFFWGILSMIFIPFADKINRLLDKRKI